MFRIITLIILFNLSFNCFFAQLNDSLQKKLLDLEISIYNEIDCTIKNELILKKINLLTINKMDNSLLLNEYQRVDFSCLADSLKTHFFWNSSLVYFFNNDIYTSLYYQKKYEEQRSLNSDLDSTKSLLFKYILFSNYDSIIAKQVFNELINSDEEFKCIACLNKLYDEEKIKGEKFYKISSILFPGIYSFKNHNYFKGITSLGLNIGTFIVIRHLYIERLYFNLFTWGGNLLSKFYLGNRTLLSKQLKNSKLEMKKKRAENCTLELKNILDKYPLEFFIF